MSFKTAAFAALFFLASTNAWASEGPEEPLEAEVEHTVAITFSPIHLVFPIFEVTGEYRFLDELGGALILGAGTVSPGKDENGVEQDPITVLEIGTSGRFYPIGDFDHGLQLGLELAYLFATTEVSGIAAQGEGFTVGPFAGYKLALDVGFTFEIQLGGQYIAARASADNGAQEQGSQWTWLGNLNFGWSF